MSYVPYYEEKQENGVTYHRIDPSLPWHITPVELKEAHARIAHLEKALLLETQSYMRTEDKLAKAKRRIKEMTNHTYSVSANLDARLKYIEDGLKALVSICDRLRQGE